MTELAEIRPHVLKARAAMLSRALGIRIDPDDFERTATRSGALALCLERTRAVPGSGPSISAAALGALREALFEVCGADRTSVQLDTPFGPFLGRLKFVTWRRLQREAGCKLPPPTASWTGVVALFLVSVWLVAATVSVLLHVAPAAQGGASLGVLLGAAPLALVPHFTARAPGTKGVVGEVVRWMVATSPAPLRGGTEWTESQVTEVVDAAFGLRWRSFDRAFYLSPEYLARVATFASLASVVFAAVCTVVAINLF